MQEGAKLCHTVGSYCSSRILGSCTERKTGSQLLERLSIISSPQGETMLPSIVQHLALPQDIP
jgi:hypothetical protein